jgi:hypothetical protein
VPLRPQLQALASWMLELLVLLLGQWLVLLQRLLRSTTNP